MPGAPCWLSASRVLYLSTGLDGRLVPVSGLVLAPRGPVPPGGRPVVAWAHPTTGVATGCAPSLLGRHFFEGTLGIPGSISGLSALLAAGFAIAATDYPGLGTPGPHPYLVGESEGRAVLDSVRAARGLLQVGAGNRFAVWGNSQGGQAALFAGQLAAAYAPELSLLGVAAAAPPTDLAALLEVGLGTDIGKVLAAYSLWAWSRVYQASLSGVVSPAQQPAVDSVASTCVTNAWQALAVLSAAKPLREGFPSVNPGTLQPWQTLLAREPARTVPGRCPPVHRPGHCGQHCGPGGDGGLRRLAVSPRRNGALPGDGGRRPRGGGRPRRRVGRGLASGPLYRAPGAE